MTVNIKDMQFFNKDAHSQFREALTIARKRIRKVRNRKQRRRLEVEASYLIREIRAYGFRFVPELYLTDKIDALRNI